MRLAALQRFGRASGVLLLAGLAVACAGTERGPSPGGPGDAGSGSPTGSAPGAAGQGAAGSGVINPMTGAAGAGASGVSGAAGSGTAGAGGPAGAGAAGTSGAAGTTGSAGTGGAAGITGAAGTSGAAGVGGDAGVPPPPCRVQLAGSFSGLVRGPASVLRVHATVSGFQGTAPKWRWTVTIVNQPPPPKTILDGGATVDIKLLVAGTYQMRADIEGAPECNTGALTEVFVDEPGPQSFLFRVTPPSSYHLPILEKQIAANALASTPVLDLGDARSTSAVMWTPLDELGFPLPSYVRVSSPGLTIGLESYTGGAPFVAALATARTYQLVIVPDGDVAPLLLSGFPDMIPQKIPVSTGILVDGEARDENDRPVVDARLLLRNELLPSTIGASIANGRFTLLARAGIQSAIVVPPAGSGLPEARVSSNPGIDLRGANTTLTMKWGHSPAGPLKVTVRGTDGTTLVSGARVHVESVMDLPSVGTLTVHVQGVVNDAVLVASGSVRADAVTDAKGVADLGVQRAGDYRVIVAPPDGSSAATTTATLTLPVAGLARDIRLASPVTVSGALTPASMAPGTRVTAIDQGVLAPTTQASAIADAAGNYALPLASARGYELLVEPPPGRGLARAVVAVLGPGESPGSKAVPAGLPWSGTVTTVGTGVAGALVQVFCQNCLDTKLPVAQGVTRSDGTLSLVLPDLRP